MPNATSVLADRVSNWLDRLGRDVEVPPADVLAHTPTVHNVKAYPEYYILGGGYDVASATDCGHGYNLTDSYPSCP